MTTSAQQFGEGDSQLSRSVLERDFVPFYRNSPPVRLRPGEDFIEQVEDIITVGEFYEKAAGRQIFFS